MQIKISLNKFCKLEVYMLHIHSVDFDRRPKTLDTTSLHQERNSFILTVWDISQKTEEQKLLEIKNGIKKNRQWVLLVVDILTIHNFMRIKKNLLFQYYIQKKLYFLRRLILKKKSRLDRSETKSRVCRQFYLSKKIFHFFKKKRSYKSSYLKNRLRTFTHISVMSVLC